MRTTWTFSSAGRIIFGTGAVRQLGDVLRRLRLTRALVVTDTNLVQAGVYDEVRQAAGDGGNSAFCRLPAAVCRLSSAVLCL